MSRTNGHRVISTTTVMPTPSDGHGRELTRRIELTPCDVQLLFMDPVQKGLLFRKPEEERDIVGDLKRSLSRALAVFYPLAGRLTRVEYGDGTFSMLVNCDPLGATYVHAVADGVSVADVLDPVNIPDDIVYSFFPMNEAINYYGVTNALLAVQVTELVDGIFVALTANHCAIDGTSFWKFFNTWSQISRDPDAPRVTLGAVGASFLDGLIDLPIRIPTSLADATTECELEPPRLVQRMFHFSKAKVAELKAQANTETGNTSRISSLQALLANLWVAITRNRRLNADEEVSYGIAVGLRSRLDPPLPEDYLGNAVVFATPKATAGEILRRGMGSTAVEIGKAIATWTVSEVRKWFEEWADSPDVKKKGRFPPNFLVTGSSPRFDVYGNDFGWGKPVAVRSGPGNKFDGKLTVFPGAEDSSIDFEACLSAPTLEALARDPDFLRTLASCNR